MSFSRKIKEELSKISNLKNKDLVKAELLGYLESSNATINNKIVSYKTANEYNINRFSKLLKNINIQKYKFEFAMNKYKIEFKSDLLNTSDLQNIYELIQDEKNIDIRRAFVRGTFMGSGYFANPETGYHLEIALKEENKAKFVKEILEKNNIIIKSIKRRGSYCLYAQDGEQVVSVLAFIGANHSVLRFEEIRVMKEMKNKVNRMVNCETFNLNKTINASNKHVEEIKKLKKSGKFNLLDEKLKVVAEARLKYPEYSLKELADYLNIGKSAVNYRLNKIMEYTKI